MRSVLTVVFIILKFWVSVWFVSLLNINSVRDESFRMLVIIYNELLNLLLDFLLFRGKKNDWLSSLNFLENDWLVILWEFNDWKDLMAFGFSGLVLLALPSVLDFTVSSASISVFVIAVITLFISFLDSVSTVLLDLGTD